MIGRRAAAAIVAVAIGAMTLTACHHNTKVPVSDARFFLPGYIPPGMKIADGSIQQVGPEHPAFGAAIGQPGQSQSYGGVILILASQAAADRTLAPNEDVTPVDINGVKGRQHDDSLRGSYVDWFAHGLAAAISGPAGAVNTLIDVARHLVLPTDNDPDKVALGPLPTGYQTITSGTFTDRDPEAGEVVEVGQQPGPSFRLVGIVTDAPLLVALGGGDTVQQTTVNGHPAFETYRSRDVGAGSSRVVEGVIGWAPRPGIVLSIISNSEPERLRPIAEGVRGVTEDEFRSHIPTTTSHS